MTAPGRVEAATPVPPAVDRDPGPLEAALRAGRAAGRKLLVPYVTGGLGPSWLEVAEAVAVAGADALEVGIPFSDPVMDGPTIQEASATALAGGATPAGILAELGRHTVGVPVAAMTYVNLAARGGFGSFADRLARAGVAGCILPDLPLEEAGPWLRAATDAGVETVMLAAPTTPDDRLGPICAAARGFVYGVGLLGVTGERANLADTAQAMAARLKAATDKPVLIGVGVSTPEQAVQVCGAADGVIVGSALVRRLLEGGGPEEAGAFVAELRAALDA
ncbi:MAG TPA: tryptophan synthase subunit alpha [Acidimicrobiales bacterium]|nr:tryptophan synthase subunit alpha [Acidimicrobiales bacterium]